MNTIAGIYLDEGASSVTLRENVIRAVGNTIHLNTGNRGKPNETKRSDQVFDGNTDEQREWEKTAGLQPEFAHLAPDSSKSDAVFKQAELLHHWPLDGDYVDQVTGRTGQAIGDAGFSKTEKARGSAALQLNGKSQWADLGDVEWPDRFTVCLWVKMPMDTTGEKALFSTPGLRVYSGVNIGSFREDLRTTTIEGEHSRDARTEAGVLPCGQWNHVVITIDRWHEAQRVYVNGEDVTNTDHLGHEGFVRRGPLLLGVHNGAGSSDRWRDLNGWVDDVRIYRDHLRAGEVRKLANTPQRMHVDQR